MSWIKGPKKIVPGNHKKILGVNPFSTYTKCSEELTFATP